MNIIENTPDRLIVEHVPWRVLISMIGFMTLFVVVSILFIIAEIPWGGVIFLAIGAGLPALVIYMTVARSQLILDRTQNLIDHRRRGFRGTTRHPLPLDKLARVYVGQNGTKMARLFLEVTDAMDAGHHAFPKDPVALEDAVAAETAIQNWLAR